jgi:hypothetical protein
LTRRLDAVPKFVSALVDLTYASAAGAIAVVVVPDPGETATYPVLVSVSEPPVRETVSVTVNDPAPCRSRGR